LPLDGWLLRVEDTRCRCHDENRFSRFDGEIGVAAKDSHGASGAGGDHVVLFETPLNDLYASLVLQDAGRREFAREAKASMRPKRSPLGRQANPEHVLRSRHATFNVQRQASFLETTVRYGMQQILFDVVRRPFEIGHTKIESRQRAGMRTALAFHNPEVVLVDVELKFGGAAAHCDEHVAVAQQWRVDRAIGRTFVRRFGKDGLVLRDDRSRIIRRVDCKRRGAEEHNQKMLCHPALASVSMVQPTDRSNRISTESRGGLG
jgi:hypothetical protein